MKHSSDGVYARSSIWDDIPETDDSLRDLAEAVSAEPWFWHFVRELIRFRTIGELTADRIDLARQLALAAYRNAIEYDEAREARTPTHDPVVYYIRRGDLIKIGTTIDAERRMRDLLPDEVLATEPGSYDVEAERHRQFAEHRAGRREYFRAHVHLLAWIERVRREHGVPELTYRPLSA